MRLMSLILALLILGGLVTYYKSTLPTPERTSDETVKEQARQIIDDAKKTTEALQQQLEKQNKDFEKLQDRQ